MPVDLLADRKLESGPARVGESPSESIRSENALVALETAQADLLERICNGPTLPASALQAAVAAEATKAPVARRGRQRVAAQGDLLGGSDT
jgi:hypothetical protein